MASNNEDSSSLDATVINKNDISVVVPSPRNTAPHPRDGLTASPSPKYFHDNTVHHLGDPSIKDNHEEVLENPLSTKGPTPPDQTMAAVLASLAQQTP